MGCLPLEAGQGAAAARRPRWRAGINTHGCPLPPAQVDAEDARRIGELSLEISREDEALAELRAQTRGLEAKAAALQAQIDSAGGRGVLGGWGVG